MEPLMSFEGYQVIENISKSNDLLNSFYQQLGVTIADPAKSKTEQNETEAITAGNDSSAGGEEAPVVEAAETAFDVILKEAGGAKLAVVKLVKDLTGIGIKEAKDLVDAAPKEIKTGVTKKEAESIKKQLKKAGAVVVSKESH